MKKNGRKRSRSLAEENTEETMKNEENEEVAEIPEKTKILRVHSSSGNDSKRLIVVLDRACLQTAKSRKTFELLDCDKHKALMMKHNIDPSTCRPDICHQSLLMLMDSPLNKAGFLQVYIRTEKKLLIEIHPQTRIPRTFPRFSGLMVQLLHKYVIRAADANVKLMKVVKNDLTKYLPLGCPKISTSFHTDNIVDFKTLVPTDGRPLVVVIGAMAHGSVNPEFTDQTVSVSSYPLSAALTCAKICSATEEVWGIK